MPQLQYATETKREVTISMLARSLDAIEKIAKENSETLEQWIIGAIYDKFQDEDAWGWWEDYKDRNAK
jgi:hypothetical protein